MELTLFVVEPDSLRRRLVCESVAGATGLRVIGAAASLLEEEAACSGEPDMFLVDVSLLLTEGEALPATARRHPDAYFVFFGTLPDLRALLSVAQLPVRGFLSFNHLTSEEFGRSLQVIAAGGAVIEPFSAQLLLEYLHDLLPTAPALGVATSQLTSREQEVLELVRRGLSNKEIAIRLGISLGTVRAHLRSIFRKLEVTSRAGAAVSSLAAPQAAKPRLAR